VRERKRGEGGGTFRKKKKKGITQGGERKDRRAWEHGGAAIRYCNAKKERKFETLKKAMGGTYYWEPQRGWRDSKRSLG